VRLAAAAALGRIGADAQVAIRELVEALTRPTGRTESEANRDVRRSSAEALISIADVLQQEGKTEAIDDLVYASAGLKENGFSPSAEQVSNDADMLRSLRWFNLIKGLLVWIQRYRSIALGISAYVLLWLFLYWKSPRLVFHINEALKPVAGYKLPRFLGGIPLSYLVLGGFFHYRPRVLDAWVAQYIGSARLKFEKKRTVEQRAVHVELPVLLDDKGISALSVNDLRLYFERKRTCVLICGEGGAGKTSLACQLCRWAMASDDSVRLGKHPMLAVLLEQEDLETELGNNFLIDSVRRELRYLTDQAESPSSELVEKLLDNRRVLVAIDGFSETSQENRNKIQPGNPTFSARALVITSRLEEKVAGMDPTVVKPMRVKGNHLSTFMEAYLVRRNKKELFDDVEYFGDLGKLSLMVGEKEVTVLLAKLYGEQMISAKECASMGKLPENIPDLMLEYLNELNRNARPTRLDDRVVHKVAKVIAWECLRESFRPMAARIDRVLERLDGQSDAVEARLAYLESGLRVVQTIGAGRDRIRFTLDPLAEYLAALQVMENSGGDEQSWWRLLGETACVDFETIKGFLLALIDCCQTKGNDVKVPDSVLRELIRQQSAGKAAPQP
jgi:HEAT repeat protein